jgi:hypothetical protein
LNKSHLLSSILISVDLQSKKSYPESELVFGGVSWTYQFMFHPQWNWDQILIDLFVKSRTISRQERPVSI